ncbi:MAG: DUF3459 domain-containing protein, partial [Actinomycetota bacterium]
DATPWLPLGDAAACNVEAQAHDDGSVLNLSRDLIRLRRASADLTSGSYRSRATASGVWAWERGERTIVALNLADEPATVEDVSGTVRIGTDRERDGERAEGAVALAPWEGLVVETG